jgi:S-adenosylmethionine/arginine decarboxylase-like enzyme
MENKYWGMHFLVDCANCNRESIKNADNIRNFIKTLVERIDMKAYGDPILAHFATHDPSKGGYTVCQMIETSLIDGHFVDETGEVYISVHSCKEFSTETVKNTIIEFFEPTNIIDNIIFRRA